MSDTLTLEMAQKQIAQLEIKNLELQASAIAHELTSMDITMEHFRLKGPILQATHKEIEQQLMTRRATLELKA